MSEALKNGQKVEAKPNAADDAVRQATREAVLMHARLGQPVCTLRDGKVVWLTPQEVFDLFASGRIDG